MLQVDSTLSQVPATWLGRWRLTLKAVVNGTQHGTALFFDSKPSEEAQRQHIEAFSNECSTH